jgi:DNA-directed RNA polymerase subunit beta'
MPFYNCPLGQKGCGPGHQRLLRARSAARATIDLLDDIKDLGFKLLDAGGLSFGITDLRIPGEEAGDHRRDPEARRPRSRRTTRTAPSPSASATTSSSTSGPRPRAGHQELMKELKNDRRDETADTSARALPT